MNLNSIIRRLTPVETARLMGFADDYLDVDGAKTADAPRYKACGNSWGVNCAEWVNSRIEIVLREKGEVADGEPVDYATTCSGVEAHSLSVRGKNWKPHFFCEIEPFPCRVLATRYPEVPNLGDMSLADGTNHKVAVLSGGTPCQDFSVAGLRKGAKDIGELTRGAEAATRSSLAYHWIRLGVESKARVLLWENVPGAFSVNGGRDFAWFVHRICEAGFAVAWRVLDVQYTPSFTYPRAIPQRRRRIWLVATADGDWRTGARILFERSSKVGSSHPVRVLNNGETVGDEEAAKPTDDLFGWVKPPPFTASSRSDLVPADEFPKGAGLGMEAFRFLRAFGEIRHFGSVFASKDVHTIDGLDRNYLEAIGAGAGVCVGDRAAVLAMPEWVGGMQLPWGETKVSEAYDGTVCGLSDVLLPWSDALKKYLLSKRACEGIVRRAANRGKELPKVLTDALGEQIANHDAGVFGEVLPDSDGEDVDGAADD